MTPAEYIDEFNMLQENYKFNRVDFLSALKLELLEAFNNNPPKSYQEFHDMVSALYVKYCEIDFLRKSQRADHQGLSRGLWGCFYATIILPERKSRFPEIDEIIKNRKSERAPKISKLGPKMD